MHWFACGSCASRRVKGDWDLGTFIVLLAKQCWRLIQNLDSLCVQVMRAKYYPDGNILKAGPKKGSSYMWQSIVSGIQTFNRGCIRRVDSGSEINIWHDPWIPTSVSRKVITPRGATMLSKGEELINLHIGIWDEVLVRDIFSHVDVERILQIPLNTHMTEDFIAWNYTRSGTFSVKSAYYRELDHQFGSRLTRTDEQGNMQINPIWKDAWRLQILGKLKHFVWKVLHGVLPCFGVLAARHIPCSTQCPCCPMGAEYVQHCLFRCRRVKEV